MENVAARVSRQVVICITPFCHAPSGSARNSGATYTAGSDRGETTSMSSSPSRVSAAMQARASSRISSYSSGSWTFFANVFIVIVLLAFGVNSRDITCKFARGLN